MKYSQLSSYEQLKVKILGTLVGAAPLAFMVEHLYPGKGIGGLFCSWVILVAVFARWELKRCFWFWITISLVAALQLPLIAYFPWMERKWLFVLFLPVFAVDFGVVFGCIKLVETVMRKDAGGPSHD